MLVPPTASVEPDSSSANDGFAKQKTTPNPTISASVKTLQNVFFTLPPFTIIISH